MFLTPYDFLKMGGRRGGSILFYIDHCDHFLRYNKQENCMSKVLLGIIFAIQNWCSDNTESEALASCKRGILHPFNRLILAQNLVYWLILALNPVSRLILAPKSRFPANFSPKSRFPPDFSPKSRVPASASPLMHHHDKQDHDQSLHSLMKL